MRRSPLSVPVRVSRKRSVVVAGVAASMFLLSVGPASADGAPPNSNNCYGAAQSAFVAGPGGNPGTTNGAVTSSFAQTPSATGTGNAVTDFQMAARDTNANCGNTGAP
jgi:hypothetical protein